MFRSRVSKFTLVLDPLLFFLPLDLSASHCSNFVTLLTLTQEGALFHLWDPLHPSSLEESSDEKPCIRVYPKPRVNFTSLVECLIGG